MRLHVRFVNLLLLLTGLSATAQPSKLFYATQQQALPNIKDSNAIYISSFPAFKPDLERICGINITVNGSNWEAACVGRPFTAADSGKLLIVKNARAYPAYRKAPFTLNAQITAVQNGTATILSYDRGGSIKAVSSECGFIATDNFEVMQQAIDTCAAKGKPKLIINYEGTAYLVPERSSRPRPSIQTPALIVTQTLTMQGLDSGRTKLKWGAEDLSLVDYDAMWYPIGFWVRNAAFTIKHITMLSPDRATTNNDHARLEAIHGDSDNKFGQKIFIDSSQIVSEDENGFEGWGGIVYMNTPRPVNSLDTAVMSVTNSRLTGQGGPSLFNRTGYNSITQENSDDTLNHLLRVRNASIKGGARYSRKATGADITLGSDTVVVHDPNFSFYDATYFDPPSGIQRQPVIAVARYGYTGQKLDTAEIYWTRVKQVINDSTATFDTTYRNGEYDDIYPIVGTSTFSTSSNTVSGNNTFYTGNVAAGDRLYELNSSSYLGTVQSVQSNTLLILESNALANAAGIRIKTNVVGVVENHANYSRVYRFNPVRWSVSNAPLYTARFLVRFAAFHNTYISGNCGVDFFNSTFQALRNGRNVQSLCYDGSYCRSCLNQEPPTNSPQFFIQRKITAIDSQTWYPVAGELKVITQGPGFGFATSDTKTFLPAAPQKQ